MFFVSAHITWLQHWCYGRRLSLYRWHRWTKLPPKISPGNTCFFHTEIFYYIRIKNWDRATFLVIICTVFCVPIFWCYNVQVEYSQSLGHLWYPFYRYNHRVYAKNHFKCKSIPWYMSAALICSTFPGKLLRIVCISNTIFCSSKYAKCLTK